MKVTDSWSVAGLTVLTLSEPLPSSPWKSIIVDGEKFEALRPMYAGDISQVKDNSIGVRGEHDFTGKAIEFV